MKFLITAALASVASAASLQEVICGEGEYLNPCAVCHA